MTVPAKLPVSLNMTGDKILTVTGSPVLRVEGLSINFKGQSGISRVVDRVNFAVGPGEIVGLVGESGCGKTVTTKAILGTLPIPPAIIDSGKIFLNDVDVLSLGQRNFQLLRRKELALIPQDPMASLNPVVNIESQMTDIITWRGERKESAFSSLKISSNREEKRRARKIAYDSLRQVNIAEPERVLKSYPFQLSGGMRQRVLIAIAFSVKPTLMVADEPGTALDVSVQDQVMETMVDLVRKNRVSVLFITHDLGVAKKICDRIYVMYAGNIVETSRSEDFFANPLHPYSNGLLLSVPRLTGKMGEGIPGDVPNYFNPPPGCRYHPRCAFAMKVCSGVRPGLQNLDSASNHEVACYLYGQGGTNNANSN